MSILVFVEHRGTVADRGSLALVSKATSLRQGPVGAVVCGDGSGVDGVASEAGRHGAEKVYVVSDPRLGDSLPQPRVDVLAAVVESAGYDTVLLSNSVLASDVAAGLAARLDAGLNWDLSGIEWRDGSPVGTRTALADSVLVEVGWRSPRRVALFRTGVFEADASGSVSPEIVPVAVELGPHASGVRVLSREPVAEADGVSIESADVVVAAGMGLGGPEHMALAEGLAQAFGGAVGATRAVVYAGWYPRAAQIGQTGKTVAPKLYLALGVSGAVQHRVGMQSSKVIVAINKDPNAPIFECADLGIVGDVHAIVPTLTELVRAQRSA